MAQLKILQLASLFSTLSAARAFWDRLAR